MPITLQLSALLRDYVGGKGELSLEARDVRALLRVLESEHPKIHRSICDDTGAIRRHVNVFVNDDHIRELGDLDAKLKPGDVVSLFQAVSGG
ncbi:MAG: MoaD/ThiS family protein [Planctomycetes bacterium]|nr:MoaD/ThiS family protein [Planctomycetota bacterium]